MSQLILAKSINTNKAVLKSKPLPKHKLHGVTNKSAMWVASKYELVAARFARDLFSSAFKAY